MRSLFETYTRYPKVTIDDHMKKTQVFLIVDFLSSLVCLVQFFQFVLGGQFKIKKFGKPCPQCKVFFLLGCKVIVNKSKTTDILKTENQCT